MSKLQLGLGMAIDGAGLTPAIREATLVAVGKENTALPLRKRSDTAVPG